MLSKVLMGCTDQASPTCLPTNTSLLDNTYVSIPPSFVLHFKRDRYINNTTVSANHPCLHRFSISPFHVSALLNQPDDPRLSCLGLPLSLPYEVETLAEMDDRLELIACRLVECVKAREWDAGFRMWDSALSMWVITACLSSDGFLQLD